MQINLSQIHVQIELHVKYTKVNHGSEKTGKGEGEDGVNDKVNKGINKKRPDHDEERK